MRSMTTTRLIVGRGMTTALLGAALLSLSPAAFSAGAADGPPAGTQTQDIQARRHALVEARLNRMANRLEIKASQQGAWKAYAATVESLPDTPHPSPPRDADAAALLRFKA